MSDELSTTGPRLWVDYSVCLITGEATIDIVVVVLITWYSG